MNLTLQVFAKDLRRYWPLVLLAAGFIICETLGPLWGLNFTTGNRNLDPVLHGFGKWPVIFILVVAAMQEDLTVGDRAFWRTRPIGPGPLLAGKLLLFALALVVPSVLINLWLAQALATPAVVTLGIVVETTGFLLLAVLGSALVASTTRSLVHAGVAALGVMVVCIAVALLVDTLPPNLRYDFVWKQTMPTPAAQVVVACVGAAAALLGLLAHQFLTLRTGRTVAWLAIAVLVLRFTVSAWTWDFITPPKVAEVPAPPLAATAGLELALEPPARISGTRWVWDSALQRERSEWFVAFTSALRSVPAGRLFSLSDVTPSFTLRDGRVIVPLGAPQWGSQWWRGQVEGAICRSLGLGFSAESKPEADDSMIRIFSLPEKQLTALGGVRGRLSLKFSLNESAFREQLRLPLSAGASWSRGGQMWRVDAAGLNDEGRLRLTLSYLRATSMVAPYGSARPDLGDRSYGRGFVVLNRSRGEYTMVRSTNSLPIEGVVAGVTRTLEFGDFRRAGRAVAGARLDPAWIAGAELVILETAPLGQIKQEIVLPDFVLPRRDERSEVFW